MHALVEKHHFHAHPPILDLLGRGSHEQPFHPPGWQAFLNLDTGGQRGDHGRRRIRPRRRVDRPRHARLSVLFLLEPRGHRCCLSAGGLRRVEVVEDGQGEVEDEGQGLVGKGGLRIRRSDPLVADARLMQIIRHKKLQIRLHASEALWVVRRLTGNPPGVVVVGEPSDGGFDWWGVQFPGGLEREALGEGEVAHAIVGIRSCISRLASGAGQGGAGLGKRRLALTLQTPSCTSHHLG